MSKNEIYQLQVTGEMDLNLALKTHPISIGLRPAWVTVRSSQLLEKKKRKERPIIYSLTRSVHILSQDSLGYLPRFTFLLLEKFLHHEHSLKFTTS